MRTQIATEARVAGECRISPAGAGALLLDVASGAYSESRQERILWSAAAVASAGHAKGIIELTPGLNNLLLVFDPLVLPPSAARTLLLDAWAQYRSARPAGRVVDIQVRYGGPRGPDLEALARAGGMGVEAFVRAHSSADYSVACIGSYPGFAYLTGLPGALFAPRRQTPRASIAAGSVIIGGAQAGVMPCAGPSGWHVIGHCELSMFDPQAEPPCRLAPGDRVRFHVDRIDS